MPSTRLISADTRSALLIGIGVALPAATLALSLSAAALVVGLALAAIVIGLGIAGTAPTGRGTLPVDDQPAYDQGMAVGLVVAGIAFGLTGQPIALIVFAAAGVLLLGVSFATSYVAPTTHQEHFL